MWELAKTSQMLHLIWMNHNAWKLFKLQIIISRRPIWAFWILPTPKETVCCCVMARSRLWTGRGCSRLWAQNCRFQMTKSQWSEWFCKVRWIAVSNRLPKSKIELISKVSNIGNPNKSPNDFGPQAFGFGNQRDIINKSDLSNKVPSGARESMDSVDQPLIL